MPKLIRFFITHILIGFAVAAVFVAVLLYFDVMGIWTMLKQEERWPTALFLLWFGNATVFGAVQLAYAVMTLKEDED